MVGINSQINNIQIQAQNHNDIELKAFTAPTIHSSYQDLIDSYSDIMEIKDNTIAKTIANHRRNKERISATALGAAWGVCQGAFFAGIYGIAKAVPKIQNIGLVKWFVNDLDKWVARARTADPTKSARDHLAVGILSKTAWLVLSGAVLGFAADWYSTYMNTRINGKVSNTKQGCSGDCWMLSGLNSLANTKAGKEVIKDSIKVNNDNSITIKFKGINKEYNITRKELKDASREYIPDIDENGKVVGYCRKYSKGDGDVLAFELAFEKYRDDLKKGKITLPPETPSYAFEFLSHSKNPLEAGTANQVYYLLTGKKASMIDLKQPENFPNTMNLNSLNLYSKQYYEKFIKDFSSNPNKYAATCNLNIKESIPFKNKHHEKVKLISKHAYAIKNINSKYVTLIDPHKSRVPIEIPLDMFKEKVGAIWFYNLSDENDSLQNPLKSLAHLQGINDKYINEHY